MKVLTPYIGRREGAPDCPGLLAPERASEPIDGDAEVVLPPALRRELLCSSRYTGRSCVVCSCWYF
jgi:hypothetical protein